MGTDDKQAGKREKSSVHGKLSFERFDRGLLLQLLHHRTGERSLLVGVRCEAEADDILIPTAFTSQPHSATTRSNPNRIYNVLT